MKILYRYCDPEAHYRGGYEDKLNLELWAVAKETPCGYWIFRAGHRGVLWQNYGPGGARLDTLPLKIKSLPWTVISDARPGMLRSCSDNWSGQRLVSG